MKLILLTNVLTLISSLWPALCTADTKTTNHLIKFSGMKNGYESNPSEAKLALLNNLRKITGYEQITIDSFDEQATSWHADDISAMENCPEEAIRNLYTKIKTSEDQYTRPFKMYMLEDFAPPNSVTIDWIGPCENVGRKRSQDVSRDLISIEPTTTIGAIFSTDSPSEPSQPTTTIDPPITFPPIEDITTIGSETITLVELTTTPADDESAAGLRVEPNLIPPQTTRAPPNISAMEQPALVFTPSESSNLTAEETSLTAQPPATTTTTSIPTTTATSLIEESMKTESPSTDSTTTQMPQPIEVSINEDLPTTTTAAVAAAATTTTTTTTTTTISSVFAPSESSKSSIIDDGPYYGKYIGLSAAFLIFVAYLVCSQGYRRQGMYELHNE